MATCADASIFFWFFHVSTVMNSLISHFTLIFIYMRMTLFLSCNHYNKSNISSYFLYACMNLFLHICYLNHFYLFICHLLVCTISFFSFLLLHFLAKFRLKYTHELHTHTLLIIVAYFVNTFYCTNLCSFMRFFQCFISPFPAFIIISICTHSHVNAKHWWHTSISIHRYILTSTKI